MSAIESINLRARLVYRIVIPLGIGMDITKNTRG